MIRMRMTVLVMLLSAVFFLYAAEEPAIIIPPKNTSVEPEKSIPTVMKAATPEQTIEQICKERQPPDPIGIFFSVGLIVSLVTTFGFIFYVIVNRSKVKNEDFSVPSSGKLIELEDALRQKDAELAILRENVMKSGADSPRLMELEKNLSEKENTVKQLQSELAQSKRNTEKLGEAAELERLRKDNAILQQEKIEFLTMIENLQKMADGGAAAPAAPQTQQQSAMGISQDDLDSLLKEAAAMPKTKAEMIADSRPVNPVIDTKTGTLSQDMLNELLNETMAQTKPTAFDINAGLSQDDLNLLIQGADQPKKPPVEKKEIPVFNSLESDDEDTLIEELSDKKRHVATPEDLEKLLTNDTVELEEITELSSSEPVKDFNQNDLDALFEKMKAGTSKQ